jgi:hypothetical protein
MKIRHRNQKITRTLCDSSSNQSRCQSASRNASKNSSIRRRSNKSKNSRLTSLTTKKKKLKKVIIRNIMKKMRVEKIRNIIRFESDALKIQTKSTKIKNALRKQSKIIRKIIVSITIHNRIYVLRVNEIRIKHIDENNQTNFITYLQKNNTRLHSNLIIKKMIWSQKIIREKKILDSSYRDRYRKNDELIIVQKCVQNL